MESVGFFWFMGENVPEAASSSSYGMQIAQFLLPAISNRANRQAHRADSETSKLVDSTRAPESSTAMRECLSVDNEAVR